jgi:hypothetical protein
MLLFVPAVPLQELIKEVLVSPAKSVGQNKEEDQEQEQGARASQGAVGGFV